MVKNKNMKLNNFLNSIYVIATVIVITGYSSCANPNDIEPPPADVGFVPDETVEVIPFEDLLTLTQSQTFKYFWDFAEPTSGLAREDSGRPNIITMGGSGFGIASFIVGVERGWITKGEAIDRMDTVLSFLEGAQKYHGAFSHWYDNTGNTIQFSALDDGGDIVETALLMQGLLIARQYFSNTNTEETEIRSRITVLWEAVEWTW